MLMHDWGWAENEPQTFNLNSFCHTENSFETFFFFRLKRRMKMMTFLERMSCKYSGVIGVDCWLAY
jgi:hypothetical protein